MTPRRVVLLLPLLIACGPTRTRTTSLEAPDPPENENPDTGNPGTGNPGTGNPGTGNPNTSGDYRLTFAMNLAPPLPNSTGVTYDGTNLWLIAGGHNASRHTLYELEIATYTVLRSYEYENLIQMLGTGVYGLTWDGSAIWISISGNTNELVRVDVADGAIVRSFSSPSQLGPSDLEFDGSLWISTGTGKIYRLDENNGGILQNLDVDESYLGRDSGIARRFDELWVAGLFGGMMVHDAADGALRGEVKIGNSSQPTTKELGALCFAGAQLVTLNSEGLTFYDVSN